VTLDTRSVLRTAVPQPVRQAIWAADRRIQLAQERAFERWFDMDVGGHSHFEETGILQGEGTFYEGIQHLPLRRAISALRPRPYRPIDRVHVLPLHGRAVLGGDGSAVLLP